MSFIWPIMLFSLLLIPAFLGFYGLLQRRRSRMAAKFGNLASLQHTGTGARLGWRRHVPVLFSLLGLSLLMLALSRPQAMVNVPRIEGTVILAFDVSGSMAATDMQPTRMQAAKAAARDFIDKQPPSVQIGIVAFSDSGFSVQAPTDDKQAIYAAINRLTPQRGTALANGILVSLRAISAQEDNSPRLYSNLPPEPTPTPTPVAPGHYTPAVIVLLTDGENNEQPDPLAAAREAASRGVRIYPVGLGSPAGTTLHINGFTVHTQLDEQTLQGIAQLTGGTYYNAVTSQDLANIYNRLDTELVVRPEKTELTALIAGASTAILLIGGLISMLWFSRLP